MAKFNFDNSRYAKFFADAGNMTYLQTFVDATDIFRMDDVFWKTQMSVRPENIPTDESGLASYTVKTKKIGAVPMMDMRAPLGDSLQRDTEGIAWYSGSIPDYISWGIKENATQRLYKEKQFEQFGQDKDIVMAWTLNKLDQIKSAHYTLSNVTAQLISNGVYGYEYGRGIHDKYIANARIEAKNKKKAGAKVWTAADCKILSQMAKIEFEWREENGMSDLAMRWKVDRNTFYNVILKNEEVITHVSNYRTLNKELNLENMTITEEMFREAIASFPDLSPIEVITEKQYNMGYTENKAVNGWNPNNAVLCPAGYVGEILKTETLDRVMAERFGASDISSVFASIEGGLMTIFNTTVNNGRYKEWHSDLIMSATPTLTEAPYHVIVDMTTAD